MREREAKPRGLGRPFVSPYISLCADCQVCTCRWAYGQEVPGRHGRSIRCRSRDGALSGVSSVW